MLCSIVVQSLAIAASASIALLAHAPQPHASCQTLYPCLCLCLGFALQMMYKYPLCLFPDFLLTTYTKHSMSVPISRPLDNRPGTRHRSKTHLAVLTPLLHCRVHLHAPRLLSCPGETCTHGRLCDLHRRYARCHTDEARESGYRGEGGRPRESS